MAHEVQAAGRRGGVHLVTVHALTWLVLGNAVGVLLATLLVAPHLAELLSPFSYGRWTPVHLNAQLYGWSALPLVALLLRAFLPADDGRGARLVVAAWSGSLLLGALVWLGGGSDGKLFLEWSGVSRWLFASTLLLLLLVLASGLWRRWRSGRFVGRAGRAGLLLRSMVLLLLAGVPVVWYWAASPRVYPAVNPDSGGATGGSLLGSTLGIVALVLVLPYLAELQRSRSDRSLWMFGGAFGAHLLAFAALDHGDRSHHEWQQLVALGSLILWLPLLILFLRHFEWPAHARPWLLVLAAWGALLLATALFSFLPGVLERWKFTNALVAHAHLAMAGVITALNGVILLVLDDDGRVGEALSDRAAFVLWNGGSAALVGSLLVLGSLEAFDTGRLFRPDVATTVLYGLRLAAGLGMLVGSWRWLTRCVGALGHDAAFVASRGTA